MDPSIQLALTIILPAIISIGVAWINNVRQKKLEFTYDYRKFILEKRKRAYDTIENIINEYHFTFYDSYTTCGMIVHNKSYQDKISGYVKLLANMNDTSIWYSINLIQVLNDLIYDFDNFMLRVRSDEDAGGLQDLPDLMTYFDKFEKKHIEMVGVYFKDIMELDQIDMFKSSKIDTPHRLKSPATFSVIR
jgi:hypothetical protein